MRINICFRLRISGKLIKLEDVDSSFIWDFNYLPSIGDKIDYALKRTSIPVDFEAKVVKRTFYPDDTVLLEVEVPEYILNNVALYIQTKNNE